MVIHAGMFGKIRHLSRLTNGFIIRSISYSESLQQNTYSSEDKAYILRKINEKDLPRKAISGPQSGHIFEFIEKNGLNSLEDLLKVNGIGPIVLRKMCDKILAARDCKDTTVKEKRRRGSNLFIPQLSEDKKKELSNVVAIHMGTKNIAWALVDILSKNVLDWNLTSTTSEDGNMISSIQMITSTNSLIPKGDLYIMEDFGFGRQRLEFRRAQLTAMLLTTLQVSRGESIEKLLVGLLKQNVINNMYNATIGSERVSLQNCVVEMLEERSKFGCLIVPWEFKDMYYRHKDLSKEDLAQALLLAMAFINVIINNRTISIS